MIQLFLSWAIWPMGFKFSIHHATSCGGYDVFDPPVSPSVSPVFLVSPTPLKPLNRISFCSYEGHNVYMHISTGNFDLNFFLGVTTFLNLEIWSKWKILLKQFVSATPLKPLNGISWNFVVVKDIPCRCAYLLEILIQFFFPGVMPFFNIEIWPKLKILLKTVFQRNSSETA